MTASDPVRRQRALKALAALRQRRDLNNNGMTLATLNPQRQPITDDSVVRSLTGGNNSQREKAKATKRKKDRISYADACGRHRNEWHDRNWWHAHCDTIVFISSGYYFLDGSYWYPALGYDPLNSYYDYDGPIYTYSNLLPDEVIANVQAALQEAGYYFGPITGSLDPETRAALANFQRDYGLEITGAIDEPTVEALGLE